MFIFRPVARSGFISNVTGMFVFSSTIQRYDGTTLTTPGGSGLTNCSAVGLPIKAYMFGGGLNAWPSSSGVATNTIREFTGTSTATSGISMGSGYGATSAAVNGSVAFIFGGTDGFGFFYNTILRFNESTLVTDTPTLAANNYYSAATTLSSNTFIFGGNSGGSYLNTIQRYDGTTRSTDGATLAGGNMGSAAVTVGSNMFIFGGYDGTSLTSIQRYNGTTRSTDAATLTPVSKAPAVGFSGNAFIFVNSGENSIKRYNGTTVSNDAATLSFTAASAPATSFAGSTQGFL